MAQDEYYYEIQLTNKQLIFYFIAAAAGFILSFVAGIMVGRGVDAEAGGAVRVREEVVTAIPEEPTPVPGAVPVETLTYGQRLESKQVVDRLEPTPTVPARAASPIAKPTPTAMRAIAAARSPQKPPVVSAPTPGKTASAPTPTPKPAQPTARAAAPTSGATTGGAFTLQVGAFKDKDAADSLKAQLQRKGLPVYVVASQRAGTTFFNVRIGSYATRSDAEKMKARIASQEKLQPFIVQP